MPPHRTEFKIKNLSDEEEIKDIQKRYYDIITQKKRGFLTRNQFNKISKELKNKKYNLLLKGHETYTEVSPGNTNFNRATRRIEVQTFEIIKDDSKTPSIKLPSIKSPSRFTENSRKILSRLLGRTQSGHNGGKKHKTRKNRKK